MEPKSGPEIHFERASAPATLRPEAGVDPRRNLSVAQGDLREEDVLFEAPEVQRVLIKLYEGTEVIFKPEISRNETVSYPELEETSLAGPVWARQILEFLEREGILAKEPSELYYACPECASKDLTLRARCPSCKGEAFKVGTALEHLNCGHADLEESFLTAAGFRCPSCGKGLKTLGLDYRRFSNYYLCINCRRLSGIVDDLLLCKKCGKKTPVEEARNGMLFSYRLVPESRQKVARHVSQLEAMRGRLSAQHCGSKFGALVPGRSGAERRFDLIAWAEGEADGERHPSITANIVHANRQLIESDIASALEKALDVQAPESIVVVSPEAPAGWVRKAKAYGVTIVEAPDLPSIASVLETAVVGSLSSTRFTGLAHAREGDVPPEPALGELQAGRREDAPTLSAIRQKQDELSRLIHWLAATSDLSWKSEVQASAAVKRQEEKRKIE